jgi:predicted ArsR family transcriptional regulator
MPEEDSNLGFNSRYDQEDFEEAVEALEVPTLDNITDYVGCSRQDALSHLKTLEKRGCLSRRTIGPKTVWRVTDTSGTWCGLGRTELDR